MPIDPSAPEDSSRLPHQRLVERSIPGIENASPEQLIRADGVGLVHCARSDSRVGGGLRFRFPCKALARRQGDAAGARLRARWRSPVLHLSGGP
jgi:hypothetical protein